MSAADRAEIENLLARLAFAADEGDVEGYAMLFADDAVWEMRLPARISTAVGREDIAAKFRERVGTGFQGPASGKRHVLGTHSIDVDGDRASGKCYMIVHVVADGVPRPGAVALYADEYVRTRDGWRLARRKITPG